MKRVIKTFPQKSERKFPRSSLAMAFPPSPPPFNRPFLPSFTHSSLLLLFPLSFFSSSSSFSIAFSSTMKLTQFIPKYLFRSKSSSNRKTVSKSDPQVSFGSGSSSSSLDGSNLKHSNSTPTSVLPSNSPFLSSNPDWTSGFSSETHFELVQAFKLIDKDGDGKISRSELQTVLERVGAEPPNEEELSIMFKEVDINGDGCISLEEFSAMSSAFETPAVGNELRDVFDFFDADGNGKISAEELLGVFMAIGDDRCSLEDCKRMIRGVDSNCDGFVCFEDFSKMMERQR